jgi:hypothetical protein
MGESGSANWLKRIALSIGLLIVLVVCVALAASYYFRWLGLEDLRSAVAQADELDPGWRWEDLEKKRMVVPDAENAALRVEVAHKLLPKDWLKNESSPDDEPGQTTLLEELRELEPTVQLDEDQAKSLRQKLKNVEPALTEARLLAGQRTGRSPALAPENALTGVESQQNARALANLLWLDVALLAHDKQPDAALQSCRALLNAGRSVGDEPLILSHLVRIGCQRVAIDAIERTLAQGQASEEALAVTQHLLVDEVNQPNLLHALRGERAYGDILMGWMEAGDPRGYGGASFRGMSISNLVMGGWLTANRASRLTFMTEAVEIAKLPPNEQPDRFQVLDEKVKALPQDYRTVFVSLSMPAVIKMAESFRRSRADLRCAIATLAAERYRLAHGRWPETLQELVPNFIPELLLDPYDRKPLRFKRLDDGGLIYSVGPDRKDDGGKIDRKNYTAPGTDMGFRLWNVEHRRQTPAP